MRNRKALFYSLLGFGVSLAVYFIYRAWAGRDRRPSPSDAERMFRTTYPGIRLVDVKITVDEAYARNFLFHYVKPGSEIGRNIEIQYMRAKGNGSWVPTPPAPVELK